MATTEAKVKMASRASRAVLSFGDDEFEVVNLKKLGRKLITLTNSEGVRDGFVSYRIKDFTVVVPLTDKKSLREATNQLETMTGECEIVIRWYGLDKKVLSTATLTGVVLLDFYQGYRKGSPVEVATFTAGTLDFANEE